MESRKHIHLCTLITIRLWFFFLPPSSTLQRWPLAFTIRKGQCYVIMFFLCGPFHSISNIHPHRNGFSHNSLGSQCRTRIACNSHISCGHGLYAHLFWFRQSIIIWWKVKKNWFIAQVAGWSFLLLLLCLDRFVVHFSIKSAILFVARARNIYGESATNYRI